MGRRVNDGDYLISRFDFDGAGDAGWGTDGHLVVDGGGSGEKFVDVEISVYGTYHLSARDDSATKEAGKVPKR